MTVRAIIEIDRDKCNGCGLCTTACAEGALMLDKENKAVLVKEIYCDGLGACLDVCPTRALKVIQKECADYDAKASYEHVLKTRGPDAAKHVHGALPQTTSPLGMSSRLHSRLEDTPAGLRGPEKETHHKLPCGCPGTMAREIKRHISSDSENADSKVSFRSSELSQWPIQLHLVSPHAPYFNECDLLIAADCTAFALGSFHPELLKGKKLAIACPKLDDTEGYVAKLAELVKNNTIYSLTVAIMEVPCCSGLFRIVEEAVRLSGKNIHIKKIVIGIEGDIRS